MIQEEEKSKQADESLFILCNWTVGRERGFGESYIVVCMMNSKRTRNCILLENRSLSQVDECVFWCPLVASNIKTLVGNQFIADVILIASNSYYCTVQVIRTKDPVSEHSLVSQSPVPIYVREIFWSFRSFLPSSSRPVLLV